ncbi:hypothetical protein R70006_03179 [Paraburkholderia domus]|nr:hypothetical protein R70006_03179 [Paraburkholderia domus]
MPSKDIHADLTAEREDSGALRAIPDAEKRRLTSRSNPAMLPQATIRHHATSTVDLRYQRNFTKSINL